MHNRRLHLSDNGEEETGDKGAQQSTTNVFILFLEQKVVEEREKLAETNTMDRGTSERVTEASQAGTKSTLIGRVSLRL